MNTFTIEKQPMPRMRTIRQTAAETGLHEYFLRQLVKQEKIIFVKAGRKVLINLDRLYEYLERGEQA